MQLSRALHQSAELHNGKMDAIALDFCIEMEKRGMVCAPIPTNEAEYDPRTGRSRCIISLKHAAQAGSA